MLKLLWTDYCFLTILFVGSGFIVKSLQRQPVRQAYRQVFKRPMAVSASIILCCFLIIATLDSIRFVSLANKPTITLLDKLLSPLGRVYEKTYSAPFSWTLYSSETVIIDGKITQVYPHLHYVSTAIKSSEHVLMCVTHTVLFSLLISLVVFTSLLVLMITIKKPRHGAFKITPAFISAFTTLFFCIFVSLSLYGLSRDFHILGTGKIGEDIFFSAIKSIRTGLVIGLLTTTFMLPFALFFGITAGYLGGLVDDIIQYLYTTLSSIPGVLLISASVLSMQTYITNHPQQFTTLAERADMHLLALCFILGVTSWTSLCRLLRAEALKLREIDFVKAAQTLGSSTFTIIRKHLLPNVMPIVLMTLVLDFSFLVLAEAVLSYVGVGVSPLTMSWGNMINAARLELARVPIVWWPVTAAFICMFLLVLASNVFADAIRDAFDPKMKE